MAPAMEYRRLGKTGLKVSALGFGAWVTFGTQVHVSLAKELLQTAYDAGVNFFDNAEVYANGKAEEVMGEALDELQWPRENYVLSTKVYFGANRANPAPTSRGLSRKHVIEGVRASLRRLRHEYADIVFAHRPDDEVPIEEVVRAFSWVIDHGLAFYWGTSEWPPELIQEAVDVAERLGLHAPTAEQPEYNLFARRNVESGLAPLYESPKGLGTTVWSPLASGVLSGKYSGGSVPEGSRFSNQANAHLRNAIQTDLGRRRVDAADALRPIADELGTTVAALSLAWILKNPNVSVILLGSSKVSQLEQNLEALKVAARIDDRIKKRIEDATRPVSDLA